MIQIRHLPVRAVGCAIEHWRFTGNGCSVAGIEPSRRRPSFGTYRATRWRSRLNLAGGYRRLSPRYGFSLRFARRWLHRQ